MPRLPIKRRGPGTLHRRFSNCLVAVIKEGCRFDPQTLLSQLR